MQACRLAYVMNSPKSLKKKYDTIVGERGVKLSGGTAGSASPYPAVLADPRHTDSRRSDLQPRSESEALIQKGLKSLMQDAPLRDCPPPFHGAPRRSDSGGGSGEIVERGTHSHSTI